MSEQTISSRGSQVFDLAALRKSKAVAAGEGPVCTWQVVRGEGAAATAEHPLFVLREPPAAAGAQAGAALPHHLQGSLMNPSRRTGFAYKQDGVPTYADIVQVDGRFVALLTWLGERQVPLRLSGVHTETGYAVYRLRAVHPSGGISSNEDGFLQLVIDRLLTGRVEEEAAEDEEEGAAQAAPAPVALSDIGSMTDFLACAGSTLPQEVRRWARRNLTLIRSQTISADERRHAQRALSMMLHIRWRGSYFPPIDPQEARRILDEALYGLDGVKQRIMETIIQINRTHTLPAYGLLLTGPAGVGKSQIAYAVARILRLPWAALDMSAITDTEALTGSPRVYANAKPGLIMEAFSQAGASNLVFIINELDKAGRGGAGANPADALLTLLDNLGYTDNYIECRIPTTGVYPIATANDKAHISAPLMSRFAVIDIPDYTEAEKQVIFTQFSLPKVLRRMGMRAEECVVTAGAAAAVVAHCAGTSGCRDLEQAAEHLAAHALYRIETEGIASVTYDEQSAGQVL